VCKNTQVQKNDPSDMELSELLDDVTGRIDIKTHLKIFSWNCHYGLDLKKCLAIMKYKPEMLILQECTKTDFEFIKSMMKFGSWYNEAGYSHVYSHDRGLGLAILFNRRKINSTHLAIVTGRFRHMIPYEFTRNDERFIIFVTWINPTEKKKYGEHFYEDIDYYKNQGMLNERSIAIGNFNTFVKNDKGLKLLEEKMSPLVNCTKVGSLKPTFYYTKDNMGVDDFCFVGEDMINNFIIHINRLSAWDKAQDKDHHWRGLSDHSPIIVDLQGRRNLARTKEEQGGAG
jgi:exonuclease III